LYSPNNEIDFFHEAEKEKPSTVKIPLNRFIVFIVIQEYFL
jgi:hypothetical protein